MISAVSQSFVIFAIIAAIAFRSTPRAVRARVVLPVSSAALLWLSMPDPLALSLLAGFLVLSFIAVKILGRRKPGDLVVALAATLVFFFYLKSYPLFASLPFSSSLPVIVGLSYIVIRCLQVMIDVHQGTLAIPSFGRFVLFTTAWPTLLSGPIMTYQDFSHQVDGLGEDTLSAADLYGAFSRIVTGAFFVIVCSALSNMAFTHVSDLIVGSESISLPEFLHINAGDTVRTIIAERGFSFLAYILSLVTFGSHTMRPVGLALGSILYLLFLYFNFSGYTNIVIGLGRLVGLTLPENFNLPWACRNFLDLWARWHMTLAAWFKTYVFNTMVKSLLTRWPSGRLTAYYAVAAFFVTFFLVGIWHGPTLRFALCGLELGLGVSVNKLWQMKSRALFGKSLDSRLRNNFAYRVLCSAAAMAYLAFCIIPFWASDRGVVKLLLVYGLWGQILSVLIGMVMILPISIVALGVEPWLRRRGDGAAHPLTIGFALAATLVYLVLFPTGAPDFVYQRF